MEQEYTIICGEKIPKILIGTNHMTLDQLKEVCNAALEIGIKGFDTSPNYRTEASLGKIINGWVLERRVSREDIFVQDKIDNEPLVRAHGNIQDLVQQSLEKLDLEYIDSLLLHWPTPDLYIKAYKQLEVLLEKGYVRHIGVSNFRVRHLVKLLDAEISHSPEFNQIELHPLRTVNGQRRFHDKHNIITQAYAPLCRMKSEIIDSDIMKAVVNKYQKTPAQIILRWHLDLGIIPVFKTDKPYRVQENCNVFDFSLTDEEVEKITKLDQDYKFHIESVCCPGF
ncbi:aldo/keto reductase [Hungatella hathewayi]|uniref:aldo/keto reductase n=1 Tax=Hungatella hathewayi TaxID=154046 RepID=UPI00210E6BCF|nr:aldo/keto reductase [Hungatella hathewayi]MCQ5386534.1 aldo/keto reductase [Hungatella hathewayi]